MWKIFVGVLVGAAVASIIFLILYGMPSTTPLELSEPTSAETLNADTEIVPSSQTPANSARSSSSIAQPPSEPARDPAADQPIDSIEVVAELESLIQGPAGRQLHTMIERESVDAAWASTMEQGWSTYLLQNQAIAEVSGRPTVNCRSSMCEIQLVAYGETELDWRDVILNSGLSEQPWATGIAPLGVLFGEDNGVTSVLVVTKTRRPTDSP